MYADHSAYEQSYLDLYLTQLFSTLGTLTAGVVASAVAVPMYTYYAPRLQKFMRRYNLSKYD
jgi:hypothetical protein